MRFCLASLLAVLLSGPTAAQDMIPVQLVHADSGLCLSVFAGSTAGGASVTLLPCERQPYQIIELVDRGGGTFQLRPRHSQLALQVSYASREPYAAVVQYPYEAQEHERWRIERPREGLDTVLRAVHTGSCLATAPGAAAAGAGVFQRPCNAADAGVRWRIEPVE